MQQFTLLTLPNLKWVLKRLGYLVGGLAAVAAGLLAILLLINLPAFDEDLHPDLVQQPLNDPPPDVPDNAFYGLLGFRAAPGADFVATGRNLMQRYRSNYAAGNDQLTNADYEEILGPERLDVGFMLGERCRLAPNCNLGLQETATALRDDDYDRALMDLFVQRYNTLLTLPVPSLIRESGQPLPVPAYQAPTEVQKYALAARFNSGSAEDFLRTVAADVAFWKAMLREGRWIVDKMIAVSSLWADMQVLSEYLASHELGAAERAIIDGFLQPLSAEELDIGEAYLADARDLRNVLERERTHPDGTPNAFGRLQVRLMQVNATANWMYVDGFKQLIELSGLPAADFARTVSAPGFQTTEDTPLGFSPTNLYNLGGKSFLASSRWVGMHVYVARVHDLNAMIRAVRLQFELGTLARDEWEEAISMSAITQPYTGDAFGYDAAEGRLTFMCLDEYTQAHGRCQIQL